MNTKPYKATRVRFQTSGRLGRGVITSLHLQSISDDNASNTNTRVRKSGKAVNLFDSSEQPNQL